MLSTVATVLDQNASFDVNFESINDNVTVILNETTSYVYQPPFNDTGVAISAAIIFIFMIVGLVGNGLTIAVIVSYKTLSSNVFMRFILSLCVSDLISALISWLFLYRRTWGFDHWSPLPAIFCKFYWAADLMTSFVTALHILSFAVLRLISIKFPHSFTKIKTLHQKIWIGGIWLICFLCGFLPAWFIFGPTYPDRNSGGRNVRWPACTVLGDKLNDYQLFQQITYTLFLYVPTVGIALICGLIILVVKMRASNVPKSKKHQSQQNKEKQAVLQLVLIIFAFLIGYIPFTAYEFWGVQDLPPGRYYLLADYWFGMIEYLLLRFSECLNPLFYNLGSRKMRKHTVMLLKNKVFCCIEWRKNSGDVSSEITSRATDNLGV